MDEPTEQPKKRRGWPRGKKRGPKASPPPMFVSAPEPEAPILVRITLKNGADPIEFGCARRVVENGFHVFFYPSEKDRYRETRREFAISEIVEIEITEARQVYTIPRSASVDVFNQPPSLTAVSATPSTGPRIHSARQSAAGIIGALEQSSGPIKMDMLPNLSFGDSEA